MARHAELVADAVAAHHVARHTGDVQRLAAGVALDDGGHLDCRLAAVFEAPHLQTALQAERDFGQHVGQFLLHQLVGCQRLAELLAVHGVLTGAGVAVLSSTQRTPGNAEACAVQTSERALEAAHIGEGIFFRAKHFIHHNFAGDTGTQANLAVNGGSAQAFPAFLQHKAANGAAVVLGPDHKHIGNRAVGNPHFGAAQGVASGYFLGAGDHAAGVRAMVGLGQAKAADPLASGQLGQVLLLGRLGPEFVDGHHHQRRLHTHHGAVTGVNALDLARHQSVAHIVQAGAAIGFRNRCTQQTQRTHFAKNAGIGFFVAKGFKHARCQSFLAVALGRVAHLTFVFRELRLQHQCVVPLKCVFACHVHISFNGLDR